MDVEAVPEDPRSMQRHAAWSWSEAEIEHAWRHSPHATPNGFSVTGFPYPADAPSAYIKFKLGKPVKWRLAEARNQTFAHDALQQLPPEQRQGIHVPEVYRTIRIGNLVFIIMEYVPGRTLAQMITEDGESWEVIREAVTDKIAQGMRLLISLPVPCDAKPGPVGGGIIRHPIFKDCEAATEYDSIDILERHLNKVAALLVKEDPPTVTLERELHFYLGDLYHGNFILTDSGDLYFIDFEQAGFLLLSFMAYALADRWPVGFWIKDRLGLPEDNLEAMRRAAYWFLVGVPGIGLPVEGPDGTLVGRGRRSRANDA